MKKILSAAMAATMAFSAFSAIPASAESYGDGTKIMLLGDSIASGYGLKAGEYNYGQLVAGYLKGSVVNYARDGYSTAETLEQIRNFSDEQMSELESTDIVILSSGANDMMRFAANDLLDMAVNIGVLKEGKTPEDIPENPGLSSLTEFIDKDALMDYAADFTNAQAISYRFDTIYRNIAYTDANQGGANYKQILAKQVVPNIQEIEKTIHAVNPDARVIVQTVYNPLQFDKAYEENLQKNTSAMNYMVYVQMKSNFKNTIEKYSEHIKNVENVEIADVYRDISSLEVDPATTYEQRYGWYFTNMQGGKSSMDVHPNQAGHVAIAVSILNQIGEKHDEGSILEETYAYLPNREKYPAYALEQFNNIAGYYELPKLAMGDVTGEGLVDSDDASMVLTEYSLLSTSPPGKFTDEQRKAADVTRDNLVDGDDASAILTFYSYLSTGGTITDINEWLSK